MKKPEFALYLAVGIFGMIAWLLLVFFQFESITTWFINANQTSLQLALIIAINIMYFGIVFYFLNNAYQLITKTTNHRE